MQLTGASLQGWVGVTLLLCAFGLLREIRPSEPFVSEFILGEWRNVTETELYQNVYPVGTYSYLTQLVLVFLLTDYLRFKPVIVVSGICGIIVYAVLLWTESSEWLQVTQFFYGLYMATEVAYYTYIFAKVAPNKYARVSSYTRMAALAGRFVSGLTAQLLTGFALMDYRQLNYITFTTQILATFWAFWLPTVKYSVYFHRDDAVVNSSKAGVSPIENVENIEDQKVDGSGHCMEAFTLISRHARTAYSRGKVIRWSLLYATSMCLFTQAQYYVQILWMDIQGEERIAYNGGVEAVLTLLGGLGAWLSSVAAHGLSPGPLAALQSLSLFLAVYPANIYLSYAGYILLGVLYHYIITLTSTKIARELSDESCFGLIFGINTLVGTALQSLLTFVIISDSTLALPIRHQFYTISGCYLVLSASWTIVWIVISKRAVTKSET